MREVILTIENLHYWYSHNWTRKKYHAVKGVSLEVLDGEAFGFLGQNGSGKTTTIKNIMGLVTPHQGTIKICGQSSLKPSSRSLVGYVPEYPYFYDYLTVIETMTFMAGLYGIERSDINDRIDKALLSVKFPKSTKLRLRTLSKGLVQKVAIAQAILHSPRLLILDEPFSGLDPVGRRDIRDFFENLKVSGTSLFISSHILSDVEYLCDKASIMVDGKIKGFFNLTETEKRRENNFELVLLQSDLNASLLREFSGVCSHSGKLERWTFKSEMNARSALKVLIESSTDIESFMRVEANLEDTFMDLVKK